MLPLLLGAGGAALGGAGLAGGLGALAAGSIGSGLGSYLQTGNLGQGIQTGLMSYLGGKALGSLMGSGADPTAVESLTAGPEAVSGMGVEGAADFVNPSTYVQPASFGSPVAQGGVGLTNVPIPTASTTAASTAPSTGIFSDPTAATQTPGSLTAGFKGANLPFTAGQLGSTALAGSNLLAPQGLEGLAKKPRRDIPEAEAAVYDLKNPGSDYRPGFDEEFSYFADGGLASLKYGRGGKVLTKEERLGLMDRLEALGPDDEYTTKAQQTEMDLIMRELSRPGITGDLLRRQEGGMMPEPNDKELISNAVDAIEGRVESPEIALAAFVARYGEEALRDLVGRVQRGEFARDAMVEEGMVRGVGDGMDDMVPATLEGEQDVVLSDGEFIVPADVVSGLGNGSSDAGSDALYEMMDRVRKLRTGKESQPDQVPQEKMLPA